MIAVTPHPLKGDRERRADAGMDGYVNTPVRAAEPFAEIERCMAGDSPKNMPTQPAVQGTSVSHSEAVMEEMILDRATLMDRVVGDTELLTEIILIFFRDWPCKLAGLRDAASRGDATALSREAHTLKGALGNLASPRAYEAAINMERISHQGNSEATLAACEELIQRVEELTPLLQEMCCGVSG